MPIDVTRRPLSIGWKSRLGTAVGAMLVAVLASSAAAQENRLGGFENPHANWFVERMRPSNGWRQDSDWRLHRLCNDAYCVVGAEAIDDGAECDHVGFALFYGPSGLDYRHTDDWRPRYWRRGADWRVHRFCDAAHSEDGTEAIGDGADSDDGFTTLFYGPQKVENLGDWSNEFGIFTR